MINDIRRVLKNRGDWYTTNVKCRISPYDVLSDVGIKNGLIEVEVVNPDATLASAAGMRHSLTLKGQRILYPNNMEDLLEYYD